MRLAVTHAPLKRSRVQNVELLLTSAGWTVRPVVAEVPFPDHGGVVRGFLQQPGQGDFGQRQTGHGARSKVVSHAVPQAVAARQDGRAGRGAGGGGRMEVRQSGRSWDIFKDA